MISSSPAKNPAAGSMELGGSLFSSISWLEFFGPGRVELGLVVTWVVVLALEEVVPMVLVGKVDDEVLPGARVDSK